MGSALERQSPEGIKLHPIHSFCSAADLWLEVVGIYVKKRASLVAYRDGQYRRVVSGVK